MSIKNLEVVHPPTEDNIGVVAISTTVTAEQDTGVTKALGPRQYNFVANVDVYLVFSGASTITDPVIAGVASGTNCFLVPANTIVTFELSARSRYFVAISTTTGYLRWYRDQ